MAPGAIVEARSKAGVAAGLKFIPLVRTGNDSGLQTLLQEPGPAGLKEISDQSNAASTEAWLDQSRLSRQSADPRLKTEEQYVLAARIVSDSAADEDNDDEADAAEEEESADESGDESDADTDAGDSKIDVMLVADLDILESVFFQLRQQPPSGGIEYRFQNVTMVLNLVDVLAGDTRFVNIRKRKRQHATLKRVENRIREAGEADVGRNGQLREEAERSHGTGDRRPRQDRRRLEQEAARRAGQRHARFPDHSRVGAESETGRKSRTRIGWRTTRNAISVNWRPSCGRSAGTWTSNAAAFKTTTSGWRCCFRRCSRCCSARSCSSCGG